MSLTDEECAICLDKLQKEIAHTTCNHFFHYKCIIRWMYNNNNKYEQSLCPLCSQLFEIKNIYLSETLPINKIVKEQIKKKSCHIL